MIHDDGTMDVMHNGQVERRAYTIIVAEEIGKRPLYGHPVAAIPDTEPHEQVLQVLGQEMPTIIDVKWPEPQHCQTLVPIYLQEEF